MPQPNAETKKKKTPIEKLIEIIDKEEIDQAIEDYTSLGIFLHHKISHRRDKLNSHIEKLSTEKK